MGIIENYRSSADHREILRILQKASSHQENFIWQSINGRKVIIPIHHFEIDFVLKEVVIFFDTVITEINMSLPLFVKLSYRQGVFKVSAFRFTQNSLSFLFPQDIKTLDLRSFPRHQFSPTDEKVITLRPSVAGHKESGHELHVRAIDISEYGLGLVISEKNKAFLKNNRILWITRLGYDDLSHPVLCEVVYISNELDLKYQSRKQKDLKVGIKLSGYFPNHTYQKFIQ